jgi:hypothetical protein
MCGGAELFGQTLVKLDAGPEAARRAADDREHERQAIPRDATTAYGEPPAPAQVLRRADSVFGKTSA